MNVDYSLFIAYLIFKINKNFILINIYLFIIRINLCNILIYLFKLI